MSCSCPTAETTGTAHIATARTTRFRAERQQILEAPAASRENDDVDLRMCRERAQAGDDGLGRTTALDARLADDRLRR